VKDIFVDGAPETSCQRKEYPKLFPLANCQCKFSLCLGLPAAAGGVNCPFLQSILNVKLGALSKLILFLVFFWISVAVVFLGVIFGGLGFWYSHPHLDAPSFLSFFMSIASDTPIVASGPLSAMFSSMPLTADSPCFKKRNQKNMFRICMMYKNLHHYLLLTFTTLEQKFR